MPGRRFETDKFDVGIVPQAVNDDTVTGLYFDLSKHSEFTALFQGGSMAATKASTLSLLQAQDASGTGSKAVSGISAVVTANQGVSAATLVLSSVQAGDKVTINGITFEAHADTTTAADREFAVDGNDSADADELVSLINDSTYGVEGVTASNDSGTITLISTDPGKTAITVAATTVLLTLASVANSDVVTINGLDFTGHTDTTTLADREFAIDGNDSADADELVSIINDATYGVPGVTATNDAGTITLQADDLTTTILVASSDGTFTFGSVTVATAAAQAFVSVLADQLDTANGFTHVAPKVVTDANTIVTCPVLRSGSRYTPEQAVAASDYTL